MEAPQPSFMETKKEPPKIIKEFEIELDKEMYFLKIGKFCNDTEIYFCVNPKNNSLLLFEGNYSLNDLCKLNQSFRFFNSINDLINAFDDMINNKKILIEKNENNYLSLKLGILMSNFMGKEDKVLIDLKINELSEKEGNNKLLSKIFELENKLKQKDEEIKIINKKFEEFIIFNKKLVELEKRIEKIENKSKIKIQSDILTSEDIDFIKEELSPNRQLSLELLYKCDEFNDTPEIFHKQCDEKKNVLVFIETTEGVRFGGYTSVGFNSTSKFTVDNNAFIFSVDKKKIYHIKKDKNAIFCNKGFGPCFCGTSSFNIYIETENILKGECHTSSAKNNSYDINSDFEINNLKENFFIKKLEIFKLNNYCS